jgi:hypothetical protein
MTMPNERTRALLFAYDLLNDLCASAKTPGVPDEIRDRALHVLRHYPDRYEIASIAEHDARGALMNPMLDSATAWKHSSQEDNALMAQMPVDLAAALLFRIERKELFTEDEMLDRLGVSRQTLRGAVKFGEIFTVEGLFGANFYPAFFADEACKRRTLGKVSRVLVGLSGSAKFQFFTSKSNLLGNKTPLEALADGTIADVMIAAASFAEH